MSGSFLGGRPNSIDVTILMTYIDYEGDSIDFKAAVIVPSFQQIDEICLVNCVMVNVFDLG
jgi:hypothetical protein